MLEIIILIITIRESFLAILFLGYFGGGTFGITNDTPMHEHLHQHLTLQAIAVLIESSTHKRNNYYHTVSVLPALQ